MGQAGRQRGGGEERCGMEGGPTLKFSSGSGKFSAQYVFFSDAKNISIQPLFRKVAARTATWEHCTVLLYSITVFRESELLEYNIKKSFPPKKLKMLCLGGFGTLCWY